MKCVYYIQDLIKKTNMLYRRMKAPTKKLLLGFTVVAIKLHGSRRCSAVGVTVVSSIYLHGEKSH